MSVQVQPTNRAATQKLEAQATDTKSLGRNQANSKGDDIYVACDRKSSVFSSVRSLPQTSQTQSSGTIDFEAALEALAEKDPEAAKLLSQTVESFYSGGDLAADKMLEKDLTQAFQYIDQEIESALAQYDRKMNSTDPRAAFLWTVGNMITPGNFPGRTEIAQMALLGPLASLEQDLQEMAIMAGEPPFGLEDAAEFAKNEIGAILVNVTDQLDGTDEQKVAILEHYTGGAVESLMGTLADNAPGIDVGIDPDQAALRFCTGKWARGFILEVAGMSASLLK